MHKISIQAKTDFLERLSTATPIKAVSELIWNGLDAGANHVGVRLETNKIDGLEIIRVKDSGSGIEFEGVQNFFGNLGDSWKKKKGRFQGRALHGKSGQGRFKAFALGQRVEWHTVYESKTGRMRYEIIGRGDALTDIQFTDPIPANGDPCGTEVVVSGIEKSHGSLLGDSAVEELAKLFAA